MNVSMGEPALAGSWWLSLCTLSKRGRRRLGQCSLVPITTTIFYQVKRGTASSRQVRTFIPIKGRCLSWACYAGMKSWPYCQTFLAAEICPLALLSGSVQLLPSEGSSRFPWAGWLLVQHSSSHPKALLLMTPENLSPCWFFFCPSHVHS